MHGFCHVELPTLDLDRALGFYGGLFNWKLVSIPGMNYALINNGDTTIGGIQQVEELVQCKGVAMLVEVEDIDKILAKATSLGGRVAEPKKALPNPDWGCTGYVAAPDGYVLGLWSKA